VARIVCVTQFFPPETFAGANRLGSMIDVLARTHDVTVVTASPSYPDPALYDRARAVEDDRERPYRVARPLAFVPHGGSLLTRAVREHLMALRLALRAAREPAEVVVTSSPSMFLGPVCLLLARARSSLFVWDIRDIGWDYAGESRMTSRRLRPAQRWLQRYMWAVTARADLLVAASPGAAGRMSERVRGSARVVLVENSVSRELIDACKPCAARIAKPRPLVAYVGLIGDAQAVGVLVDVAQSLPDVDFLIVGDGPERAEVDAQIAERGVRNVTLTGYLDRAGVLDVYTRADILFGQLRDAPTLNATSLPSKLYEYMATGKPVVYAGHGGAAELVDRVGCGVSVEPESADAIATAVGELLGDATARDAMGRRGRAYVESAADREAVFAELAAAVARRL